MTHYWDMETVGLSRRRAEIAYRVFGWAVRLLGGEVAGGGYGDTLTNGLAAFSDEEIHSEAIRRRYAPLTEEQAQIEARAMTCPAYQRGDKKLARAWAVVRIMGYDLPTAHAWVRRNFPD